jgi:probable rRNA maturation factor
MKVDLSLDSMDDSDSESGVPLWSIPALCSVIGDFLPGIWPGSLDHETIEISVNLLSEEQIRNYNKTYRNIDQPTDVLSFPLWESEKGFTPPETMDTLPLGDILICSAVVRKNSCACGTSYSSEMSLMLAHGVLHLLGLDHDTDERKKQMWQLQDKLLPGIRSCLFPDRNDQEKGGLGNE